MHYGVCICFLCCSLYYIYVYGLFRLHLDVDVDTCGHFQSLKSVNRLLSRCDDVDQSLVCPLLELLAAVLIFVNSAEDRDHFLLGGSGTGPLTWEPVFLTVSMIFFADASTSL